MKAWQNIKHWLLLLLFFSSYRIKEVKDLLKLSEFVLGCEKDEIKQNRIYFHSVSLKKIVCFDVAQTFQHF